MSTNYNLEAEDCLTDSVPVEVMQLAYAARLEWHCERIRRDKPVFEFLESIESELDESDLIDELLRVRYALRKIDEQRRLLAHPKFIPLKRGILTSLEMAAHSIGTARERHLQTAQQLENELVAICMQLGIPHQRHLRVSEFTAGGINKTLPSLCGPGPAAQAVLECLNTQNVDSSEEFDVEVGS